MSLSRESPYRKTSITLLAISIVVPIATWWYRERERHQYLESYGMEPEGVATFGIVAVGALATFVTLTFAALYSIRAFRALERPRSMARVAESVLLCLLPTLLVAWAFFVVVVLQEDTPQIIRIQLTSAPP